VTDREINIDSTQSLLEIENISKSFPGVMAIDKISFELREGEIHALVGENGAGKSTLIKILTGAHRADTGEIKLNGQSVTFHSPLESRGLGIAAIYQEFTLIPILPVHANLFLGREKKRNGFIDIEAERKATKSICEKLGVGINPDSCVSELSIAHQQIVEIARALTADARILIMDEPTAALSPREVDNLFLVLKELKQRGIGIIFISHRLDEVFAIADRITVIRDGKLVGTWQKTDLTRSQLITYMVGRPIDDEYPNRDVANGEKCLEVENLSRGNVKGISFSVKRGEILGIAGLMGAGRTEVTRLIFGADHKETGKIILDGHELNIRNPRDAIRNGICLLTEDRKSQGLVLRLSARENFALPNLPQWSRYGILDKLTEKRRFEERTGNLKIRLASPDQKAESLSGGNQQKLLVARWLETNFQVIIFDEPTRGIDVGAKYEMYLLINELAKSGKAVIVVSSDLPEILGICDRILVMKAGQITGEIGSAEKATQEDIMALAV
jgi:ribose transport system ATP-binding protein